MSPTIKVKKVDSKGRVILPNKNLEKVFITEVNDVIIMSKEEEKVKNTIESIQSHNQHLKLEKLEQWDDLLQDAELLNITTNDIDKAVLKSQQKKLSKVMEDQDG